MNNGTKTKWVIRRFIIPKELDQELMRIKIEEDLTYTEYVKYILGAIKIAKGNIWFGHVYFKESKIINHKLNKVIKNHSGKGQM